MTVTAHILPAATQQSIWGIAPAERTRRQLGKLGIRLGEMADDTILLLRGDVIYEDPVLRGLAEKPGSMLLNEDGTRLAVHGDASQHQELENWLLQGGALSLSLNSLTPATAGAAYNRSLRKRAAPHCYVVTASNVRKIEWHLYKASYKGVTDIVTKYVWPVPAYYATRWCARRGLSPNMVTTVGALLMITTFLLFWQGWYGTGLLAGWAMTFLDTVDGKLARCTLTSSKWGNIFDHGIDIVHPPFWYIAWGVGLAAVGFDAHRWLVPGLAAMFASYVVVRLCEGYFIRRFGFHVHVWRRRDSFFRMIVARRNPNMLILTFCWLVGRPDIGLLLVIIWTLIAIPVHIAQIAEAETARRQGKILQSWLSV